MRIFLSGYLVGMLTLNFLVEDIVAFYWALTVFPVTLYLLLTRKKKQKKEPVPSLPQPTAEITAD